MGLDLTIASGAEQLRLRLQAGDVELLEVLRDEGWTEVRTVFVVPEFGVARSVPRGPLFDAVEALLARIEQGEGPLPVTYGVEIQVAPGVWMKGSGGCGARIGGEIYAINAGVGYCNLEHWAVGKDGQGYVVETTDIRSRQSITTDDQGEIRITRRVGGAGLRKLLKKIKAFLRASTGESVDIILG